MKRISIFKTIVLISCIGLAGCEGKNAGKETHEHTREQKAAYCCPMKCEGDKTYTAEGQCPVCGMNLKAVE